MTIWILIVVLHNGQIKMDEQFLTKLSCEDRLHQIQARKAFCLPAYKEEK